MSCDHRAADLLPFHAAGTLDDEERRLVEAHLETCGTCRTDLALWTTVAGPARAAGDRASAGMPGCETALAKARVARESVVARAWTLAAAQVPLVGSGLWLASALVVGIGFVLALIVGGQAVLDAIAPLVAAAGLATVYGPRNDPGFELALATPTSARQILLARIVLVFGYDLALALAASLALQPLLPHALLGGVITGWLAPMAFLSALALLLSMIVGPSNAMAAAFVLWVLRGLAAAHVRMPGPELLWTAAAYQRVWHETAWLMAAAGVLAATAVWLAGRSERPLLAVR